MKTTGEKPLHVITFRKVHGQRDACSHQMSILSVPRSLLTPFLDIAMLFASPYITGVRPNPGVVSLVQRGLGCQCGRLPSSSSKPCPHTVDGRTGAVGGDIPFDTYAAGALMFWCQTFADCERWREHKVFFGWRMMKSC